VTDRRQRLHAARLYFVCEALPDETIDAALRGGTDIVQLRMKGADDREVIEAARRVAALCARHDALFILNDRPDLVQAARADGAHIGQDDGTAAAARAAVGPDRLIGVSTHTPPQIDAAARDPDVDYIGVGPVHATPTKPGRPAVGPALVAYAADHAPVPFFAIGGIDAETVGAVRAAGARRIAVVRAIAEAPDVQAAARHLRDTVDPLRTAGPGVGAAQ
jgi:thiamine-phosphate pyrophosphorylase